MTTTDDYSWLREVSDRQVLAIDALVAGGTHQEAAAAAGVHRVTVSNWARRHPGFMAEVNRRRGELRAQRTARLRELDEAALELDAAAPVAGSDMSRMQFVYSNGARVFPSFVMTPEMVTS
jgi:hypothetical protein